MIEVSGDDWDTPVYEALHRLPPVAGETPGERHERVLRVVLGAIGPMLKVFLAARGADLRRAAGPEAETLYLDGLAAYYERMADAFDWEAVEGRAEWRAVERTVGRELANRERPSIHVIFQLGLPLLCPHALSGRSLRRVAVVMHRSNQPILAFYRRSLPGARLLFLEDAPAGAMIRALREGCELVLNADTAYPGTRAEPIPFLDGRLRIPIGWRTVARRIGCDARPLALLMGERGLTIHSGEPLDLSSDAAAAAGTGRFFELRVRRNPLQWLGWGGFERSAEADLKPQEARP